MQGIKQQLTINFSCFQIEINPEANAWAARSKLKNDPELEEFCRTHSSNPECSSDSITPDDPDFQFRSFKPIDRVRNLSYKDFFEKYAKKLKPVIIEDYKGWFGLCERLKNLLQKPRRFAVRRNLFGWTLTECLLAQKMSPNAKVNLI